MSYNFNSYTSKDTVMLLLDMLRQKKLVETDRTIKKYGEELASLYIKIGKQRALRVAVTARIPDFQAHLVEVMLDRFDEHVEKKYSMEFLMGFKRFLSEADRQRLYKEQRIDALADETVELIAAGAEKHKTSVQQETYNYFMENFNI